jgi:hypothetical protein
MKRAHTSIEYRAEMTRQRQAATVCAACPVLVACRDYGRRRKLYGVWGGWLRTDGGAHPVNLVHRLVTGFYDHHTEESA